MSDKKHSALREEYPGISNQIETRLNLYSILDGASHNKMEVTAIWDTGATNTVISQDIAARLNLKPVDKARVLGVNSSTIADVVLVSIILPNDLIIEDSYVIVSDIGTDEMLIGMDIIALGDFCISNGSGKTLFSFVSPSFDDNIDLSKM